jgi:predicted ATP-grasp superfamily ATP-dependent carboligase
VSRYCRAKFRYPVSTDDAAGFADAILEYARAERIDLTIPITDWTTPPLSERRTRFEGVCRLAVGAHSAIESSADKYATVVTARECNVATPGTTLVSSLADLDHREKRDFPSVVKDRFSARWVGNRAVFGSVAYAYSEADLKKKVEERIAIAGDVLVQEFVPGRGIGFSAFCEGDRIYAPFAWLRVRETDPRGSGSSARKSVPLTPDLIKGSHALIKRIGFQGICMLEYKLEEESGRAVLMEINGRPWGSIQLPIDSGIDYPRYIAEWYLEGKLPPVEVAYKKGILCRRMVGELTHLEHVLHGAPPGWPKRYPSRLLTILKMAVPWYPGVRYDDIWLSDPGPGVAGIVDWFKIRM